MADFDQTVFAGGPVLTDGGIETRVMFETDVAFDPDVQVAEMPGDPAGRKVLYDIYGGYAAAAKEFDLPVILGTPTFRASPAFIERAGLEPDALAKLNADAVGLLEQVRDDAGHSPIFIAGVIGPSGDAHLPDQALSKVEGAEYHRAQADALSSAGVDFLFAPTFPSVAEAQGACVAMAGTGLPHVISYILGPDQRVLDGTTLAGAIDQIDGDASARPLYHSLSCIHPTAAVEAIATLKRDAPELVPRLREFKANGSPLRTDELIKLDHPVTDDPGVFAEEMYSLFDPDGLTVLGGCCGTDDHHMEALAHLMSGRGD